MVSRSQSTPLCDLWTCYFWWTELFILLWVQEINPVILEQEEKNISDCVLDFVISLHHLTVFLVLQMVHKDSRFQ